MKNKFLQKPANSESCGIESFAISFAFAIALFAAPSVQATDLSLPDVGFLLQQIQSTTLTRPLPTTMGLTIEQTSRSSASLVQSDTFLVQRIRITRNTMFETALLHGLVMDGEGKSLNLQGLGNLAARITSYYQGHGYPLARAIIPAQSISEGVVVIEVLEPTYGKVLLDNHSPVPDNLLEMTLQDLQPRLVINQNQLDRVLLLLSDIPGTLVNASLKASSVTDSSDLLVSVIPSEPAGGSLTIDNHGGEFTRIAQIGANLTLNNPLHRGDSLTIDLLTSGVGLQYGRLSYDFLINGNGTRFGGAYSTLHCKVGGAMADAKAECNADTRSLWAKHPILRSRIFNLYGQLQFDQLLLKDHINSELLPIQTDRHLENLTTNLYGDVQGTLGGGTINNWSIGLTMGQVTFDNVPAQGHDAEMAQTLGNFLRWNANLNLQKSLGPNLDLSIAIKAQRASKNLDASQKISVGGPHAVRAYDTSALSGDEGYLIRVDVKQVLGSGWGGLWLGGAFIDTASITVNQQPWPTSSGDNVTHISGAGLGLTFTTPNQWQATAFVATPLGNKPTGIDSSDSPRAWLNVARYF